jgi:hypothetical protein
MSQFDFYNSGARKKYAIFHEKSEAIRIGPQLIFKTGVDDDEDCQKFLDASKELCDQLSKVTLEQDEFGLNRHWGILESAWF